MLQSSGALSHGNFVVLTTALLRDEPDTPLLAPLRPSEPLDDDGEASWFELEYQKSQNRSSWSSWLSALAARSIALSLLAPSPQPWAGDAGRAPM